MLLEGATRVSSRTSQAYSVVIMNQSRKRLGGFLPGLNNPQHTEQEQYPASPTNDGAA